MPPQKLRDYQERGISQIFEAWHAGARSVLCTSPTGSGKTTLFTAIAEGIATKGGRALILVHRRELATQAAARLTEFGVPFGYVMAGKPTTPYANVQIASVQTLINRQAPPAGLVICDEAHLSTAKTWTSIMEKYPRAKILGVTATPWRLGGKPLIGAYDASVVVATPAELCAQGHLCKYVGFSYLTPDLSGIKTTGGDYNEKASAAAMSSSLIVDNIVEQWLKHASHLSTVVFAVTVEHSQQLTAKFKAAGVTAEHLDGKTPPLMRDAILARVADGRTMVLCNVGVAVEGLDIPRLKCCVLARPTKSLARAIQMMGRVRRPWNGITARVHDHAFNIKLHGLPDADRDYSLSAKPVDPPSMTQCLECHALYQGRACPSCDKEAPAEPVGERTLNTVEDAEQFEFASEDSAPGYQMERAPVAIKWLDIGKMVEGVFEKTWEEPTQYGTQRAYLVKGEKRSYRFHGTTRLNALMSKVATGQKVRVTYTAETALGAGKTRKEFKLEVDEEPDPRIEQARKLYADEGKTTREVGAIMGVSQTMVHRWGRDGGWARSLSAANGGDIAGVRFGRLVAISMHEKRASGGNAYWVCKCDCGADTTVVSASLKSGTTKSCGCLMREQSASRMKALNAAQPAEMSP